MWPKPQKEIKTPVGYMEFGPVLKGTPKEKGKLARKLGMPLSIANLYKPGTQAFKEFNNGYDLEVYEEMTH